jgi:hypothetical protein
MLRVLADYIYVGQGCEMPFTNFPMMFKERFQRGFIPVDPH